MQFKVPQNVQREDTIIWGITFKQMLILMIGGGITTGVYISLERVYVVAIWAPATLFFALTTLAFAFLKIHNMPLQIYYEFYRIQYLQIRENGFKEQIVQKYLQSKKKKWKIIQKVDNKKRSKKVTHKCT